MSRSDSQSYRNNAHGVRHDGWTIDRQLDFLAALARTGSVTSAAASVGMSRESAYRLRRRPSAALFAAQRDCALGAGFRSATRAEIDEGHIRAINAACGSEAGSHRSLMKRDQQRDLRQPRARALYRPPPPPTRDNRAYNAARGFRGG